MTGYHATPTSDPVERRLRSLWYSTRDSMNEAFVAEAAGQPNNLPIKTRHHHRVDRMLSSYLWNRTLADIEEDRRKHPKAKRNQPVPPDSSPTRWLP